MRRCSGVGRGGDRGDTGVITLLLGLNSLRRMAVRSLEALVSESIVGTA